MAHMAGDTGEAEASGLVDTLQGHVDDIRTLIQCGICIRPLYEPYTLACGHTFCYSCLSSWFSGGRSKRTCPDCRAPVKTQPAPAYLVRAVVQMFTSRAELLDKGETTAEHSKNQKEEAERLDKDRANTHPQSGGLFGGLFRPKVPSLKPVVDVDDGVVRCPSCAWELEDGEHCPGCGWQYRPDEDRTDYSGSDDLTDTDYDSMDEEIGEMEEDEFGDIEDSDSVWGYEFQGVRPEYFDTGPSDAFAQIRSIVDGVYQSHGLPHPQSHLPGTFTDESEYEEEEDDDYDDQDSFIDDEHHVNEADDSESDRDTVVGSTPVQHPPLPARGPSGFGRQSRFRGTFTDSEDDDDEEEYDDENSYMHNDYGADEVIDDLSSVQSVRRSSSCGSHSWDAEGSESQSSDTVPLSWRESPPPMAPSRTTGTSSRDAIPIDDSEDEQPVGPVRRGAQRRRVRFSPY